MDWTNLAVNESIEKREAKMSGLVAGFVMRMRKRAINTQGETTPGLEVPDDKRFKPYKLDKEFRTVPKVITVDSPKRVLEALSAVGGAA